MPVDAMKWVKAVEKELDKLGTYASADAFMNCPMDENGAPKDWSKGFACCVNENRREAILERYHKSGKEYKASPGDAMLLPARPWQQERYAQMHAKVTKAKAGICTTFAMAGAHLLTAGRDDKPHPRVEIVAFDNHVYILVNRTGESATKVGKWKIDNAWHKQADLVIVDPWAGAMGYAILYKGIAGGKYPYAMIKDVTLVAELPAAE